MTPRERYDAVLAGFAPDRVPSVPILMQFAAEHIGRNYGEFAADHRVLVDANLRCAEEFGFDQLSAISDPYRETAGFGAEIRFHPNAVPECVRPPLAEATPGDDSPAQLVVPDPAAAPRMRDRLDALRLYRQLAGDRYSVLGWIEGPAALAADVRGVADFLMDLLEEPAWAGQLMDVCVDTGIRFAHAQIAAGADTIGIGDAICSQISGAVYLEHILPRQRRLLQAVKAAGARIRLHICGQTRHLWSGLRTLPIDILDCDHMVDLAAARAVMPASFVLAGNLNPVAVMRFGRAEEIPAQVRACARAAGNRYLIGAGCEIPSGTPAENLRALCAPLRPAAE